MKTRILLVEDDDRLANLTAEYLRKNDFEVTIEGRGDTAEARILSDDPELVILDVMLPGKDGLIHISELAEGRTAKTEDVVSVGDVVTAKCIGIDDKGRVKMSIRAALRDAKAAEAEAAGITE